MTSSDSVSSVVLIPGHWLGAWAWDGVIEHLGTLSERTLALTLPGLDAADPLRAEASLSDQVAAIEAVLDDLTASAERPVVLVAHSGANAPVSVVLDRHPQRVRRVIWVDSGPLATGDAFAADLPEGMDIDLPPFSELGQQASLVGLTESDLDRFRAHAVAQPGGVLREGIALTNDARHAVATTLVCCSLSGDQVQEMARAGHPMFAAVAHLTDVRIVDLPTGHWPMWSEPAALAEIIRSAVGEEVGSTVLP